MSTWPLAGAPAVLIGQATMDTAGWLAAVAGLLAVFAIAMIALGPRRNRLVWVIVAVVALVTTGLCLAVSPPAAELLSRGVTGSWQQLRPFAVRPLVWGALLCAAGLYLMLPRGSYTARVAGNVLGLIGLGCFAAAMPLSVGLANRIIFWTLAIVAVGSAAAAISMRSAVYAAIWFAISLLGTAALYLYQGSQFLGVATVVVYAGAIVVTFLFVVMLAQPEGHAVYDRISWGLFPKITSVAMAGIFVVVLTFALLRSPPTSLRWQVARATSQLVASDGTRLLRDDQLVSARHAVTPGEPGTLRLVLRLDEPTLTQRRPEIERQLPVALAQAAPELAASRIELATLPAHSDVLHDEHMAHLGRELFSYHLVSVEVAGTVLLAALVGAVAIVSHGQRRRLPEDEEQDDSRT